ncbi:MAG TPA: serine hydrolase domain-containing protein [Pirellulales bacterium]|nr:serine hydrolase domain-containing protein [Pirellulales bacterium]
MDPDQFQQAWQAQASQTRVTFDADLLRKEVQRNQRNFRAVILRRDVLEVVIALLLLVYTFHAGITRSLPWTWYLTVPVLLWWIGFFLIDRIRHKPKPSQPGEPLLDSVKESLRQVEHQIWLLRNIFWWYLLPPSLAIPPFFIQIALEVTENWWQAIAFGTYLCGFLAGVYYWMYRLNQRAVRTELEPRREELLALLKSLGDDSTAEQAATGGAPSDETTGKPWRWILLVVLSLASLAAVVLTSGLFDPSYDQAPKIEGPAGGWLGQLVGEQRKEKNLVGLAAMVAVDGHVEAAAASGERKRGSGVPVAIGDRWHLGGIAKSITATMVARLVEAGRMKWTDTVGESFAGDGVHNDWQPVTLWQLLTDTAGAPPDFPRALLRQRPALGSACTQARREAVLGVVAEKPAYPPGTKNVYSNVGVAIAAAMAEQATGTGWEDLVRRDVFEPLGLADSGFGPPKSGDDTLEQPRGHRQRLTGKVAVDDTTDNTLIMAPSACIHMSLADLCKFATEHLRGELGTGKLLSAATYKLLHTPALDGYACGWVRRDPTRKIPHTSYWHNGSNTHWYALVVFIPDQKLVVAVASNDPDSESAENAAWKIVKASAKRFVAEREPESDPSETRTGP